MDLNFATPFAGAWALLGIPTVIAIHFLQTPSRPVPVSTLFLLDRLAPESVAGRRFERLRQSVPLWLQLLCVLLIALLLAQPRRLRPDSAQTIVVLLDSSVSMQPFEKTLYERLPQRLGMLSGAAAQTEWRLLETDPAAERLYAGNRLDELLAAVGRWRPKLGSHGFQPAIRLAQALLQNRGLLVFVTDRPTPVPPGVELLAVGRPIENVGFCGAVATAEGWEALVTNYGSLTQRRTWRAEPVTPVSGSSTVSVPSTSGAATEQSLELQPGQSVTLRGPFPPGGAVRVILTADEFALDDVLPLVRPQPKRLRVHIENGNLLGDWPDAFFRSEPGLDRVGQGADLTVSVYDPLAPALPTGPAIVLISDPSPVDKLLRGAIVAERDPLTDTLNWNGLLAADSFGFPRKPGDNVLLWQGDRPLVIRRGPQLLVGFDIVRSNATRLPAFVLLLHRFVEATRNATVAMETGNFETNQALSVVGRGGTLRLNADHGRPTDADTGAVLRAPEAPGFFEVTEQGPRGGVRLKGAAHFADPREADFRDAATVDRLAQATGKQRERHSEDDLLTPLWVLLLGAVMGLNWVYSNRRKG